MDGQIFSETVGIAPERNQGVPLMNGDAAGMPLQFALKQIENEINAGFAFVAAARNAYEHLRPAEGEGALVKALGAHKEASDQVLESEADQVRGITHQLIELREAIDWLVDSHFPPNEPSGK